MTFHSTSMSKIHTLRQSDPPVCHFARMVYTTRRPPNTGKARKPEATTEKKVDFGESLSDTLSSRVPPLKAHDRTVSKFQRQSNTRLPDPRTYPQITSTEALAKRRADIFVPTSTSEFSFSWERVSPRPSAVPREKEPTQIATATAQTAVTPYRIQTFRRPDRPSPCQRQSDSRSPRSPGSLCKCPVSVATDCGILE